NMRLRRSVVVMDEPPSKAIGTPLRSQAHPGGDWLLRTGRIAWLLPGMCSDARLRGMTALRRRRAPVPVSLCAGVLVMALAIAVDRVDGSVYVSFLAYGISGGHTDVYVAKSVDAGATFGQVVKANDKNFQGVKGCKNCDHEKILARGGNVYLAYGQAQYHFLSLSTDGGASFSQHTVDTNDVVTFAEAGAFDPAGNAWFAWGDCQTSNCTGSLATDYRVSETLAGTADTP